MKMPIDDKQKVIERYSKRFEEFGYTPKTLGWDKGKQDLRYHILFEDFVLEGKRILDIGCGFGDANKLLQHKTKEYRYVGIDIVEKLVVQAKKNYKDQSNIEFILGDFLETTFDEGFDIVVASGIFNFKLLEKDNYEFIEAFLRKAYSLAKEGVAFDFLSDKVDFVYEDTFHSSPSKILEIGYVFSKNLLLKNHYMPFEFALVLFKDSSFSKVDTIFTRYKNETDYYRFY